MFPVSGREITEHANGQAPDGYLIGLNPSGVYKFRIGPSVPAECLDAGSPIFTPRRAFLDCDEGEKCAFCGQYYHPYVGTEKLSPHFANSPSLQGHHGGGDRLRPKILEDRTGIPPCVPLLRKQQCQNHRPPLLALLALGQAVANAHTASRGPRPVAARTGAPGADASGSECASKVGCPFCQAAVK